MAFLLLWVASDLGDARQNNDTEYDVEMDTAADGNGGGSLQHSTTS